MLKRELGTQKAALSTQKIVTNALLAGYGVMDALGRIKERARLEECSTPYAGGGVVLAERGAIREGGGELHSGGPALQA